jgi:hypothetical protein
LEVPVNRAISLLVPAAFLFLVSSIAHADPPNQYRTSIRNMATGTCLDADSLGNAAGGAILQWPCNPNDPYQLWNIVGVGGGQYTIQNVGAGTCLDAKAQQVTNGGSIIQFPCNSADPFQLWYLTPSSNGVLSIKNFGASNASTSPANGDCLDANASRPTGGTSIIQYGCDTGDNYQLWQTLTPPAFWGHYECEDSTYCDLGQGSTGRPNNTCTPGQVKYRIFGYDHTDRSKSCEVVLPNRVSCNDGGGSWQVNCGGTNVTINIGGDFYTSVGSSEIWGAPRCHLDQWHDYYNAYPGGSTETTVYGCNWTSNGP